MQPHSSSIDTIHGTALRGASVAVKLNGALATIYNLDGTPQDNPMTTDDTGSYAFRAANGEYTLTISRVGIVTKTETVLLYDPADDASSTEALAAEGGAALVSTIASGAGTVARTVQDKLREAVSVMDFMTDEQRMDAYLRTALVDCGDAIQDCFDYCRDNDATWLIPQGEYYVAGTVTAYTSGVAFGRIVSANTSGASAVVIVAPAAADSEALTASDVSTWGDFAVGQQIIPAATDLSGYMYSVATTLPWVVRTAGGGTFNKHHTFRFVNDVGDVTPQVRVAFDNADVSSVVRKRIRERVKIDGLRVVIANGAGERSGVIQVTRPNTLMDNCTVTNDSGAPIMTGMTTHTTCMVDFRNCYVDGMLVNATNYGFTGGSWSFDVNFIHCRENHCRRGIDVQMGQDVSVIGGSYPSGVGGHWAHGLHISGGAVIGNSDQNPNPIHISGGDLTVVNSKLIARGGRGGGGFINMREDLPELAGRIVLTDNEYIFDDADASLAFWSIIDLSFGTATGYNPGRRLNYPSSIKIDGGSFSLRRSSGDSTTAFKLNAVLISPPDSAAKSTYGYSLDCIARISGVRADFGPLTSMNGVEPRFTVACNKGYDPTGNGARFRVSDIDGGALAQASASSANVDTADKRQTARVDFYFSNVETVRASVADGVARHVVANNHAAFTRVKPGGTSGYVAVGDEIYGASNTNFTPPSYPKASLPAATYGRMIFVTDDVGGSTLAFSDGSSWRRVADRAVVS